MNEYSAHRVDIAFDMYKDQGINASKNRKGNT